MSSSTPRELDSSERERLDELLRWARRAHTFSFLVAAILLVMSTLADGQAIQLPFGEIVLPQVQAAILGYGLVVVLAAVSDTFLQMALPFMRLDIRRPPFPWLLFSGRFPSPGGWIGWYLLPIIFASLGSASLLSQQPIEIRIWKPSAFSLILGGFFFWCMPSYVISYTTMLQNRVDWDGNRFTLSVYLHFWMRLVRQIGLSIGFFITVFAAIEPWREFVETVSKVAFIIAGGVWGLCWLAKPFASRLDRAGRKLGFSDRYVPGPKGKTSGRSVHA